MSFFDLLCNFVCFALPCVAVTRRDIRMCECNMESVMSVCKAVCRDNTSKRKRASGLDS